MEQSRCERSTRRETLERALSGNHSQPETPAPGLTQPHPRPVNPRSERRLVSYSFYGRTGSRQVRSTAGIRTLSSTEWAKPRRGPETEVLGANRGLL